MPSSSPIPYIDYLAGRQSGLYPRVTPKRLGLARRTVTDSSRGGISNVKCIGSTNTSRDSVSTTPFNTPMSDPVAEAVRNFLNVRNLKRYTNTSKVPSIMNMINAVPDDIRINKPIGFRANLCHQCLSGSVEAVWKFVQSFKVLTEWVDTWLGSDEIYLKAVELPRDGFYEFATRSTTKENVANKTPVIVLSFSEDLKYRDS
jgi:hypothetical protein